MHVPKGADPREITQAVRDKLGDRAGMKLLGGMPRSSLLRSLRLDEITGALAAVPVAGTQEAAELDVDVSKVGQRLLIRSREPMHCVSHPTH